MVVRLGLCSQGLEREAVSDAVSDAVSGAVSGAVCGAIGDAALILSETGMLVF